MRALVDASKDSAACFAVDRVIADKEDAPGLAIAGGFGIETRAVTAAGHVDRESYDRSLAAVIEERAPSLIVMAGFMRILSAPFVQRFAGRVLNIHPSLLPKYAGLHTHRRVLEAHDAEHGATVHFVNEHLDGGPAVLQARVNVAAGDTEESLSARVLAQEHRIYPLAVSWYCSGRLRCREDRAYLDGVELREPVVFSNARGVGPA